MHGFGLVALLHQSDGLSMSLAFCAGAKNWQRQEGSPTCQQGPLHHQDVLERRLGDTCPQEPQVIPAGLASLFSACPQFLMEAMWDDDSMIGSRPLPPDSKIACNSSRSASVIG